jgi:catechol 2,3-dioxygenase-like lactoylglutathione lyase family enzyme
MFDHVGLKVRDLAVNVRFCDAVLRPLGCELVSSGDGYAGFGPPGAPAFWLYQSGTPGSQGSHVAFRAGSRAAVQRFHEAGLASGGRDNGPPALRPDYAANYYAAFLLDPDGNNLEAVFLE